MRIAAQQKLGFYPADPELATRIGAAMRWPNGPCHVLDPCAGEGEAVQAFAHGRPVWAVELAGNRAAKCAERFGEDHVLWQSFELAMMPPRSFSACWLNPPYDSEIGGGYRVEESFLQRATEKLVTGGVCVFMSACEMDWNDRPRETIAARYFYQHFDRVLAFLHPETDLPGYKDTKVLIMIGARRAENHQSWGRYLEVVDMPDVLPVWDVPISNGPSVWRRERLSDEEIAALADGSPLLKDDRLGPTQVGRPILPLKLGHLPLVLASGRFNGVVGDHIARATITKKFHKIGEKVKVDSKGNEHMYDVQQEQIDMTVRALWRRNGQVEVSTFAMKRKE